MLASTPVRANGIAALTPVGHLLLKTTPFGFRLDDPDGFMVFAVHHSTLTELEAIISRDRKNAFTYEPMASVHRGAPCTVHFARYDKGAMMQLTYFVYLGSNTDGILVEYTSNYFKSAAEQGRAWWKEIPPEFTRFVESLEY